MAPKSHLFGVPAQGKFVFIGLRGYFSRSKPGRKAGFFPSGHLKSNLRALLAGPGPFKAPKVVTFSRLIRIDADLNILRQRRKSIMHDSLSRFRDLDHAVCDGSKLVVALRGFLL